MQTVGSTLGSGILGSFTFFQRCSRVHPHPNSSTGGQLLRTALIPSGMTFSPHSQVNISPASLSFYLSSSIFYLPSSAWFFLSLLSQTHLPTLPSTFPSTSSLTPSPHHSNCGPFLSNFCGLAPTLPSSSSSHQWCWSTARTREQLMMLSSVGAPSPN